MARMKSSVRSQVEQFNPFRPWGSVVLPPNNMYSVPASDKQVNMLKKFGIPDSALTDLSKAAAQKLIGTAIKRMDLGLASFKQLAILAKYGLHKPNLGFRHASELIDYIASTRWKPDRAELQRRAER